MLWDGGVRGEERLGQLGWVGWVGEGVGGVVWGDVR